MPLVFLTPFKKTYSSGIFSLSTFIGLVLLATSILLPLFAAYSTEDFWLRIKEYTEQPLIDYYEHYITYITVNNDNILTTLYRSSSKSSNDLLNQEFSRLCNEMGGNVCQLLRENTEPVCVSYIGSDMKKNKLKFTYSININEYINENTDLQSIDAKLAIFLKYGLTKKVKLIMTPMIYINIPISNPQGKQIRLNGDLELMQKSPIISTTITSRAYEYPNPLIIDYNDASPFDLLYYYNKYKNLNYTLKYNYEKIENKIDNNNNKLEIIIEMNIPKLQKVLYIDSVYESIKYAWMQYFYIFLPIYIILYIIFKFIIQNNIFYTNSKSDL